MTTQLTVEQFLGQAQAPEMAAEIDSTIDTIQASSGANDRQMLRAYAFLLRCIAVTMPWDSAQGLDAPRVHIPSKTVAPSWRECIGACLQLEFSPPELTPEVPDAQEE